MTDKATQRLKSQILQTKLFAPPLRPRLVERGRLLKQLNTALRGEHVQTKVTLVSAPAGFGKTTLVGHWLASGDRPYTWLSLDEDDNDPVRFVTYVVAALQKIDPALGQIVQDMVQDIQLPPLVKLLRTLINEVIECGIPFTLVLDDYHLITDTSIHSALIDFINQLPPQLHLALLSRIDPPFPLARLRLRSELAELRAAHLSFTADETIEFFHDTLELAVSAEAAANLATRTEGWVAGLQAAGLSLKTGNSKNTQWLEVFSGSSRYVLDYLVEEVMQQQPKEIQDFLLQTAILERLCAPLCNAVTETENAQTTLEMLEERNLFLVPLDDKRHWYRYHHLFADFLRNRLARDSGQDLSTYHGRASQWYQGEGLVTEAVNHALKAEDFERAVTLIAEVAGSVASSGEAATLIRWIEALPEHYLALRPRLRLAYASALLLTGQVQQAEIQLCEAESASYSSGRKNAVSKSEQPADPQLQNHYLRGQITALRALAACWSGKVTRAAMLSREALDDLPDEDLVMRGLMATNIALNLAEGNGASSDVDTAIHVLRRATKQGMKSGNEMGVVALYANLGELEVARGHLRAAEETYQRGLQVTTTPLQTRKTVPARVGSVHIGYGRLLYEWNDLDRAIHHVQEGLAQLQQAGNAGDLALGQVVLAQAYHAQGKRNAALDALHSAERKALESEIGWVKALVNAMQVRLWLAGGQVVAAQQWVTDCGLKVGDSIGYRREEAYFTLARVLLALDRLDEVLSLVTWLHQVSEGAGMLRSTLKAMVLQALVLNRCNERKDSLAILEQALVVAEPEGFVRLFIDEGPAMADLLHQTVARNIAPAYVSELLAGMATMSLHGPVSTIPPSPSTEVFPQVEPLSERECEVLRLIAAGLSNRDIADTLVIAMGTVKRHITNIYGKLDVHNRTQAVARGRDLKLL